MLLPKEKTIYNVFVRYDKTVYGEMSVRQRVLTAECSHIEMSLRQNVRMAKCPNGKMSHGEKFYGKRSRH